MVHNTQAIPFKSKDNYLHYNLMIKQKDCKNVPKTILFQILSSIYTKSCTK